MKYSLQEYLQVDKDMSKTAKFILIPVNYQLFRFGILNTEHCDIEYFIRKENAVIELGRKNVRRLVIANNIEFWG